MIYIVWSYQTIWQISYFLFILCSLFSNWTDILVKLGIRFMLIVSTNQVFYEHAVVGQQAQNMYENLHSVTNETFWVNFAKVSQFIIRTGCKTC